MMMKAWQHHDLRSLLAFLVLCVAISSALANDEQELPSGMMSMVENMRQIQKGVNPDSWLAQTPLVVVGDDGE